MTCQHLWLLVLLPLATFQVSCDRTDVTVAIVLPADFLGTFEIIEDRQNGTAVQLADSQYVYTVPQSGRLVTKDIRPFLKWHTTIASFQSGETLLVNFDSNPGATGIMLTELAASSDRRVTFLVGTAEDVRRVFREGLTDDR